jgi:D-alanine-D-alanine ligase
MRVLILTSPADTQGRPDTEDTLIQADEIAGRLHELGHETLTVAYARAHEFAAIRSFDPHLVFNLVEDLPEGPDQLHTVTNALELSDIAYTGAATEPLRLLGNKSVMKARLRAAGLPVPSGLGEAGEGVRYIVKSAVEHASLGLSAENVVTGAGAALVMIGRREAEFGGQWFAEAYVDGREFNVAVLDGGVDGPMVLPLAEILFTDHTGDTPKIVGYAEKWETESRAFATTPRIFPEREEPLFSEIERLAVAAWKLFALTGYARVDFRVDPAGRPYILEVNANPCLAADAGFCAAAAELGLNQADVVSRILQAAHRHDRETGPAAVG